MASSSSWASATASAIPEGAVPYGREADGREQFVCRGAHGGGVHLEARGGQRGTAAAQPATSSPPEPERGFDEKGEPYVITRFPDGTVERRTRHGGTRTKPDGTQEKISPLVFANAPIGTPPELPADPTQGRLWMESHNSELLSMIRALVKNSEPEMKKFDERERNATFRNLYDQIAFRTEIANFLAKGR